MADFLNYQGNGPKGIYIVRIWDLLQLVASPFLTRVFIKDVKQDFLKEV